jgi:hypothetical protein
MIVLSALVQSRTGGVTSVYSSNHLDLSYRWCCNALSGFVANTRQALALCPAPVAEELHTVTESLLGWVIGLMGPIGCIAKDVHSLF